MSIDTSISSTPFVAVECIGHYDIEKEILFSMHTVFRIGEINRIDNIKLLYQVDVELTANDDEQLRNLTKRISKEITGPTGWDRLGSLLLKIDRFEKAKEVYQVLLEQACSERSKIRYYNQLGHIKSYKEDYVMALDYYKIVLEIEQRVYPANHPILASSYNNIGGVYYSMKQYSKALLCYEKDLEISLKICSSDDHHLAVLYNNIGTVCDKMKEFSKALMFYEKVLKIELKTHPENHPTLITTYNNIAGAYSSIGEHSKAISIYQKSLDICEKSLPSNHHLSAICHGNISNAYIGLKEYAKALSHLERALQVHQYTLPPDHRHIINAQNGIKLLQEKLKSEA